MALVPAAVAEPSRPLRGPAGLVAAADESQKKQAAAVVEPDESVPT